MVRGNDMKLLRAITIVISMWQLTTNTRAYSNQETSEAPGPIAMPGCPSHCGDVMIPFPFGIGSGCSIDDDWFEIVCKTTTSSSTTRSHHKRKVAFLKRLPQVKVLNISTQNGTLLTQNPISLFNCSDDSITYSTSSSINKVTNGNLNLSGSPFSLSDSRNRLTAVGCNVFAYINSSPEDTFRAAAGCTPACTSAKNLTENNSAVESRNYVCEGRSCCQTFIPSHLTTSEISFSSEDFVESGNSCSSSYAFVADQAWFKSLSTGFMSIRNLDYVPVTLNWDLLLININHHNHQHQHRTIDNIVLESWRSTSLQCYKTEATSSIDRSRLQCSCNLGYRGNPYLSGGCIDIDECREDESSKLCPKDSICVNTPGSHHCEYKKLSLVLVGVGSGLGALMILLFSAWGYKVIKRRNSIKYKEQYFKQMLLQQQIYSDEMNFDRKTKLFNSKELEKATDHYNANRILGQGGQGTVYKGMLEDGNIVAVKRAKLVDQGKFKEFINEIVILSQINHRNVVKLLGCCLQTEVPLLVYEFIPNGTLFHYIHDQNVEFQLTWEIRLRIATEVAGALSYLHSAASFPIYHRDIKSTNILLDAKYRAKIADFGTSRSISEDQTHLTTLISGTFGYMDPEYFRSSQFTDKSDVYSFGVVIVELLSGKKPISRTSSNRGWSLITYFMDCMEQNRFFDVVDTRISTEGCNDAIVAVANLAHKCLNPVGKNRPTMREVAAELELIQKSLKASFQEQEIFENAAYSIPDQAAEAEAWEFASSSIGSSDSANNHAPSFNVSM